MTLAEMIDAAVDVVKGHAVTLVNLFRKNVTYQYPDVRVEPMEAFRGMPALLTDPTTGRPKCTACGICARTCPPGAIEVEGEKGESGKKEVTVYNLDMSRCMVCNLCVESCSFNALIMTREYELATYSLEDLVFDKGRLLEMGLKYSGPREDPGAGKERGEPA